MQTKPTATGVADPVDEFPASRPGPISLTFVVLILGAILVADNWSLLKGFFGY